MAPGADLYPGTGKDCSNATFPTSGALDWVADCNANTDTPLLSGGIATGLIAGQTSASPVCNGTTVTTSCAKGHWNGVRVVDGVGGNDQDIFLTGGKENDESTWNVGPGTVGSSKYDASQMYLANNSTTLYFGMERVGNNGTTAFDFEFNKLGPSVAPINCTTPPCYIPNRTNGDVLLTFEMSGSGSSGSAVAHYFTFTCTTCPNGSYVEQTLPTGLSVSINDSTSTAGEPWGHVTSHGAWALGSLDRFTFAEAAVPLSVLGINGPQCGGNRFVEIRTRASATSTSDLKDTTPIFNYSFGSPVAGVAVSTACASATQNNGNPTFTVDGSSSRNATGGSTGLTYHYDLNVTPANVNLTSSTTGVTLTKTSASGVSPATWTTGDTSASSVSAVADLVTAGVSSAQVAVKNTISQGLGTGCSDSTAFHTINLFKALGISASLTPSCTNTFTFSASASGGNAPYSFSWVFQIADSTVTGGSTPGWRTVTPTVTYDQTDHHSGTVTASEQGTYRAIATVTDTADTSTDSAVTPKPQCTATVTTSSIVVRNTLTAGASKTGTTLTATDPANWTANLSASSNALTGDTIAYQWQILVGSTWTNISGATSQTFSYSTFATDATPSASTFSIGTDSYNGKIWSVQLRVHITRTLNGGTCTADSSPVTVKKVIGVDP